MIIEKKRIFEFQSFEPRSSEAEIRKRKIYRVTFVGFVVNLVLSVLKLAAGIVGRRGAMVADAKL